MVFTPHVVGSRVRPKIFGCIAMGSAILCIFNFKLVLYSAGSGVNRVNAGGFVWVDM